MSDTVKHIYRRLDAIDKELRAAMDAPTRHQASEIILSARNDLNGVSCLVARAVNELTNPPAPFVCTDPHQAAEEARIAEADRISGRKFRPH